MYFWWKIIAVTVLQTILLAAAVALYAERGNPFFWIMVLSSGPWVGLLIGSIRTLPPIGEHDGQSSN